MKSETRYTAEHGASQYPGFALTKTAEAFTHLHYKSCNQWTNDLIIVGDLAGELRECNSELTNSMRNRMMVKAMKMESLRYYAGRLRQSTALRAVVW